jgi:hypothetical protein
VGKHICNYEKNIVILPEEDGDENIFSYYYFENIFRAIEFYRDSGGISLSEALEKQHAESGFAYRGSFRFHRCCLLWLTCQKEGMCRTLKKSDIYKAFYRIGKTY